MGAQFLTDMEAFGVPGAGPADQRAPGEVWDVDDDEAAAIAASAAVAEAQRPGLDVIRENWDTVEAITESMTYRDWTSWCQERG